MTTNRKIPSLAKALVLTLMVSGFASAGTTADKDLRDRVLLKDGKELRGRVIERYGEEHIVLYKGQSSDKIAHEKIQSMDTVRDRLRTFMGEHVQGLPPEEEWKLVELAERLELPEMARLQAHQVLLTDPDHLEAHKFLGHKQRGDDFLWPAGRRFLPKKDFDEYIRDWSDRFVLESEHYVVETNTSVESAVQVLFDLEFVYLRWMDEFGEDLNAGEEVLQKDQHKMTLHLFPTKNDKGYKDYYNGQREAHYDPSTQVTTARGNPNLAFTFYQSGIGSHPSEFFDIAVQQLIYSTLVLSRRSGYLPPNLQSRNAHWVELGMGYWFGRQFTGTPGYARTLQFRPEPRTQQLANRVLRSGRLSRRHTRKEITNLIGLEHPIFYAIDKEGTAQIFRAKARNLFRYLIEENPVVMKRDKVVGSGREALFYYLREVYITPTAHSSSAFDKGLGGAKIEELYDGWVKWRMN